MKLLNEVKNMFGLRTTIFIFLVALHCGCASAKQPVHASFDCAKASQPVEHAICGNAELASLDLEMAKIYKQRYQQLTDADKTKFKSEQRQWLQQRVHDCGITSKNATSESVITCLKSLYGQRITQLHADDMEISDNYYMQSVKRKKFSAKDRYNWRMLAQWDDQCENPSVKKIPNSGLMFYPLNKEHYLLQVVCERYAYQSVYQYFIINLSTKPIRSIGIVFTQYQDNNQNWEKLNSAKIVGEPTVYMEDKQFAMTRKFAGAGQCGIFTVYEWTESSLDSKSPFSLKDAWGNNDCTTPMFIDDWPEIR